MSTDIERRLRAAFEASAELITDPPGSTDHQPAAACPASGDHANARRLRRRRWVAPPLVAATVAVIAAGSTVIVRAVNTDHDAPVSHQSSSPSSTPMPGSPHGQEPAGPQVVDAELFAAGRGYVRTQHALLWTDDLGESWRNIMPPGLTPAQLQSTSIAVLPDGHAWIAVAPKTGNTTVTLLARSPTTGTWTSIHIPLGTQNISAYAAATTSLSFTDPKHGWLLVSEQITHTGFGELLRTTDGGATWTMQAGQRALPVVGTLHFITPALGYLDANYSMGSRGWWVTRDAGHSWTQLQLPTPAAKKSDTVNIISAPALAGGAIVLATSFTTPVQGNADGVGIYRSTDLADTWTVHQLASETPTEQYNFAATPDGSAYVLLREHPAQGLQGVTWVTSRSTDGGQNFTDTTSVHSFYPGPLTLADPDVLWTIAGSNGCKSVKTGCWSTTGLIASSDGGVTWHQINLPS
jgi:photosystem II stability/assembly factor-like uncharacterized protein